MKRTLLIIALAALPLSVQARTWFVARDGSGDFGIIQDAVDAAASGDTIRIGPGRYDEGRIVQTPGWTELVRVLVKVDDLTLIGAGGDRTIIGQAAEWDISQGGNRGIETATRWNARRVVIDGIRFENMTYAIIDDNIAELHIRNCSFSGNRYSVGDCNGILEIEDSRFESVKRGGFHIGALAQSRVSVARCSFDHVPDGLWSTQFVTIAGVVSAEFVDCNFRGGAGGFSGASSTHSILRRCLFDGQTTYGVVSGIGCSLLVEDCTLVNQRLAFRLSANWDVRRTTVAGVTEGTLIVIEVGSGSFRDCILAKGEHGVIVDPWLTGKRSGSPVHFDMRNNWWGTDNPDSIQAWIYDEIAQPGLGYIVDWLPFTGAPVHSEEKNLGSVKALFR